MDNDSGSETADVVKSFEDSRIHYFRTGNLSMPDNWEYGFEQGRGEYLTILPDRRLFYSTALERIHNIVERYGQVKSLSWDPTSIVDDMDVGEYFFSSRHKSKTGVIHEFTADDLLQEFLTTPYTGASLRHLPKGLNSIVHKSLVKTIRSGALNRLCVANAPDYAMAFQQLAYQDQFLYLDSHLCLARRSGGNGNDLRLKRNTSTSQSFVKDLDGEKNFYDSVPIKALFTQNSLLNDYVRIRAVVGGNLERHPLDLIDYYWICYREIIANYAIGVEMSSEQVAWQTALAAESPTVSGTIQTRLKASKSSDRTRVILKRLERRFLAPLVRQYRKGRTSPIFSDSLSALKWLEERTDYA